MFHQKSCLRSDMMNNFRAYQGIVDEIDKIISYIKITKRYNAVYGSDDFHDVAMGGGSGQFPHIRIRVCHATGGSIRLRSAKSARRIPTDEWYRSILSRMDDGEASRCVGGTVSSQPDRLRLMGKTPPDCMTIAIDAHPVPCLATQ